MDATEQFIAWQRHYNGVSEQRLRVVEKSLREMGDLAGKAPEDCTAKDFAAWMHSMSKRGLHKNTVRKHGNMVRPFFKWAWHEGLLSADELLRIRDVRNPRGASGKTKPRPYTRKQIARMWKELDETYPSPTPMRMKRWRNGTTHYRKVWREAMRLQLEAIIHLALHAGMRREEIFRAEIEDIHPDNAYVVVRYGAAKGNGDGEPKVREVPMTRELRRALSEWLEFRALLNPTHERPWLVLSPIASPNSTIPSSPIHPMNFDRFSELLGTVGSGWELHRLRHTCATEWLRAKMPLEKVSKLLGHSRIQQTLAYAEILPGDIHDVAMRVESAFTRATSRPRPAKEAA